MADGNDRWILAAAALRDVTGRFEISLGIDRNDARQQAIQAILGRLATGILNAAPKGFLSDYDGPEHHHRYWFDLRQIEPDGSEALHPPVMEPDWGGYLIPLEFWQAFKNAGTAASADWASGDFYISDFSDAKGRWNGIAREVLLARDGLPEVALIEPINQPVQKAKPDNSKNRGGRPSEYDWEGAIAHLVALANSPDGLDPTGKGKETNVSYIGQLMADWFEDQGLGHPATSTLQPHAGRVVGAINDLRAATKKARESKEAD